ncbi:hypothetical protein NPIL_130281 [Nephila pilipes]|uniref:Uncharacterized protein n=1 Tax=Nephila pilipes TaxID=299642 RepID=A0A8X6R1R6_NEPPI|nr:hypothetical protein NPIL_130281 [Nephila pilipes]
MSKLFSRRRLLSAVVPENVLAHCRTIQKELYIGIATFHKIILGRTAFAENQSLIRIRSCAWCSVRGTRRRRNPRITEGHRIISKIMTIKNVNTNF